jgi:hypothetical protein
MPKVSRVQSTFHGGEWSPFAQGQIELPQYKTALNLSRNGYPMSRGPWTRRFGFQLCGATRQGKPGRTLQFNFTDLGEYRVELTDNFARIYFGAGLVHDSVATVTAISQDTPAIMTVSAPQTWVSDSAVEFSNTKITGDSSVSQILLGRRWLLNRITSTTYTLTDEVTGAGLNGASVNFNSAATSVQAQHILEFQTPYASGSWQQTRLISAGAANPDGSALAVMLHPSYPAQTITATLPLTGTNLQGFTIAQSVFYDGPYYDPPINNNYTNGATITVTSAGAPLINLVASDATSVSPVGFQASDVGRFVRLYCEPPTWNGVGGYSIGQQVKYNGSYWGAITAGATPPGGVQNGWVAIAASTAAFWVWGIITTFTSSTQVQITAQKFSDGTITSPFTPVTNGTWLTQPAIMTWQMGLQSVSTGYFGCGCYYQGRLGLSGIKGNRVDFSSSNQLFVMSTTDEFANVGAANGIAATFNGDTTNTVFHMTPTVNGVICGTKTGEWFINGPTSGVLASNNIQSNENTHIGCANVLPVITPLTTIILHKFQKEMYEYFPDVFSGRITAPVLNERAKHLMVTNVQELAYMSEPEPVVWGRNGDGSWFGCTYRRSNAYGAQPPDYAGFHGHTMGDGHAVQSITTGPSPDTTRDALYLVTQDPNTLKYYVSVSQPQLEEAGTLLNYWGVDTGIVPSGCKIQTVNGQQGLLFYGLNGFDIGDPVVPVIGGLDCGNFTTAPGGTIFVPFQNNDPNFTLAYLQSISSSTAYVASGMAVTIDGTTTTFPCVFGFTFTAQGQLLRPSSPDTTGIQQGFSIGTTRRSDRYGALIAQGVYGSVSVGQDFVTMLPMNFQDRGGNAISTTVLYSGVHTDTKTGDYTYDDMTTWQMTRPLPLVMAALGDFTKGEGR